METGSKILLINRDRIFLKMVSRSLEDAGYQMLAASTRSEALMDLSRNQVALIVCDSELPDANGYDILEYLKRAPAFQKIPFIFLVSSAMLSMFWRKRFPKF